MMGVILAHHSCYARHMTSRRDTSSAKVASTLELKLQKDGGYMSSTLFVTLGEPGVIATRTRLYDVDGKPFPFHSFFSSVLCSFNFSLTKVFRYFHRAI